MTQITVGPQHANQFALAMSERVAQRARGADDRSERLLKRRPSEHILAGFLTPLSHEHTAGWDASHATNSSDGSETPDVPVDEPHELTNIGFEWIVPREAWDEGAPIDYTIRFALYVRVLPTYDELIRTHQFQSDWQHRQQQKKTSGDAHAAQSGAAPRQLALPEVWRRITLAPFSVPTTLAELRHKQRLALPLQKQLRQQWSTVLPSIPELYPARTELHLTEMDFRSESSYLDWVRRQRQSKLAQSADWSPVLDLRSFRLPSDPAALRVAARLVNATPEVASHQEAFVDPNLYDVGLEALFPRRAHRSGTFRELPQSYRYDRAMPAVGFNAHAQLSDNGENLCLSAQTVPIRTAPRLEPRTIPGSNVTFKALASDPLPQLQQIATAMREYYEGQWATKVRELEEHARGAHGAERQRFEAESREAQEDRQRFLNEEVEPFAQGLALLRDPRFGDVLTAFKCMNEAMGRVAAQRNYDSWRLFQLVFIVRALPELTRRYLPEADEFLHHQDRDREWIDILWFAAGGGKTEAFFGLLLWQIFLDRLRGKSWGVTALLRFPLRLLTFQQLQRLSHTLAQADLVRVHRGIPGEGFSIGYYVGGSTTPNTIYNDRHERYRKNGPDQQLRRLARCPYCSDKSIELKYDEATRVVRHRCTSSGCPNPSKLLPIYIVDDDLYRYLPTVIVSTVDKLANIGQNRRFANLLGRVDRRCAKHGAAFHTSNSFLCEASRAAQNGGHPARCEEKYNVIYGPFAHLSPALQIADELHLLREELGAFDGHYETTVMQVQRSLGAVPWKIIAATATIERFEYHAWELYMLPARRFPGPGPTASDSFYYQESADRLGRLFVGVLGVGRAHTPAVAKTKSLFLQELEEMRQNLKAGDLDAVRQIYSLQGASREELQLLLFLYEIVLTYVLTLKGGDQVSEAIDNRVRQELLDVAGSDHELLVRMLNSGVDMVDMIDTMDLIASASPTSDPYERIRALIATNIISHGVDVDRFGIIIFAGFPRQIAEYIQASARVGRTWPGISVFVPTPQAERDRSVFDRFGKFHEYVDRLVEPSALNRWPEPILRRTVPGIIAAYVMAVASHQIGREISTVQQVQRIMGQQNAACLSSDEVVRWVLSALRAHQAPSGSYQTDAAQVIRNTYDRVLRKSTVHDVGQETLLSQELNAMRSLRDVDDPAEIGIEDREEQSIFHAFA